MKYIFTNMRDKKSPAPPEGAGHSQGERRLLVIP
jgi:hypothetical protein